MCELLSIIGIIGFAVLVFLMLIGKLHESAQCSGCGHIMTLTVWDEIICPNCGMVGNDTWEFW